MKVLIVCLVLVGVALSAPPPVKKVEKGYEVKKEYHSSSNDNGYHADSYGPKPHYVSGYGKKDYNKVEVKKYGYEQERDGYGYGHNKPRGYGDDNDKGYYQGYERTEYHDDKDDYNRPHRNSYDDNKDTHVVQEKRYYGKYDSDRDSYHNRDGYGYGGDYGYGKDNSYGRSYGSYGEDRSYGNRRGSYGYKGDDSYHGGEGYGYPSGNSYGRNSHGGGYGKFQGY